MSFGVKRRILTILLLLVASAAVAIGGVPARADAADHCFAASCNNVDPYDGGCAADARTLAINATNSTSVLLRYSNTCNAAWVKIVDTNGYITAPSGYVRNNLGVTAYIVPNQWGTGPDSVYSYMVSDTTGQVAFACATETRMPSTYTGVATVCTNPV
jgi:hypothetical protein